MEIINAKKILRSLKLFKSFHVDEHKEGRNKSIVLSDISRHLTDDEASSIVYMLGGLQLFRRYYYLGKFLVGTETDVKKAVPTQSPTAHRGMTDLKLKE